MKRWLMSACGAVLFAAQFTPWMARQRSLPMHRAKCAGRNQSQGTNIVVDSIPIQMGKPSRDERCGRSATSRAPS